jgi:hypothetical protein
VLAVSGSNERAMVLVEWTAWRQTTTHGTTPMGRWFSRPAYEDTLVEL